MKFTFNLIREMQRRHRASEVRRVRLIGLTAFCFGLLLITLFYACLQILTMRASIQEEKTRLVRLKAEYQHYKASKMIVNKSDVELLDKLQYSRIFWTRKLAIMARYLPENYWITHMNYEPQALTVDGYGYISLQQQQLITLDDYLNSLRYDRMFNDAFKQVHLNSTIRSDDLEKRARVSFSYTGVGGK
jgi:hypothetical protein